MDEPFTLAVLSPVVGGFYFGGLLSGIARAAAAGGGHRVVAVQVCPAGLDPGEEIQSTPFELPLGVSDFDGYIIVTTAVRTEYLEALRAAGRPVVLVSGDIDQFAAPNAVPDNVRGIHAAVEHLYEHGHRRIGFAGNLRLPDMRERRAAYEDALRAHGLTPELGWFFEASDNVESGGIVAGEQLLEAGVPTTALVVATDRTAVGLMTALEAAGMNLPADQAVVGFDGADIGARQLPRLSTIDQRIDRVGELAGGLLLRLLRGDDVPAELYRVHSELVVRESCGCPMGEMSRPGTAEEEESATARFLRRAYAAMPRPAVRPSASGAAQSPSALQSLAELIAHAAGGQAADRGEVVQLVAAVFAAESRPDTAERLLVALRSFESELAAAVPATRRVARHALHDVVMEVVIAITRERARAELWHSGRGDASLEAQYEMDMVLLRPGHADPRRLDWLPRSAVTAACFAAWVDDRDAGGERTLRIVGVQDATGVLDKLIGSETTVADFPPVQLTARAGGDSGDIVHVISVNMQSNEWGLLAVLAPVESRTVKGRGSYNHWAHVLAVALDQEETVSTLRRQRLDLEQSYKRERELVADIRASAERYELAARAVDDGLWDWDVSSGKVYYSPRWKTMLGYAEDDIGTAPGEWLDRVHPGDRDDVAAAIAAQLGGARTTLRIEHRLRAADGSYRWMNCKAVTVLDAAGAPARIVGALSDMTDRHQLEEALRHGVLVDALTGLPTRELFGHHIERAITRCRREPAYDFTLVLLDVAGFTAVNDTLGHVEGDALLRQVAERLRGAVRAIDTAGRFGTAFAILLDGVPPTEVDPAIERLHNHMVGPYTVGGVEKTLDIRMGVAPGGRRYETVGVALREAEIALYRSQMRRRS